jgi:signal transduction histidine kinase
MMNPIKVGIVGLGTVGRGTFEVLLRNQAEIQRRAGRGIEVSMVAARQVERAREWVAGRAEVVADAQAIIDRPDIDIIIELIGGCDVAKDIVLKAIAAGKHVVTANKALLALHGDAIFSAAQAKGVAVAFEAAVAGGIPIIKAVREGLTANHIQWIAGIINGTTNFILSEMRSKGLDFKIDVAEGVPARFSGDALRLQHILANLLGNAIKFTEQGHVSLTVALLKREESQAWLHFNVEDTGIGISEEDRHKLFKPFSQVDGSITRRFGGTGLGLAISHNLLRMMGSSFTVNSQPGQGASFAFDVELAIVPNQEEIGRAHV